MKPWTIAIGLILLTGLTALGQQRDPYPWETRPWHTGQPESPPGWTCTPHGYIKNGQQTDDGPCHCEHMGYSDGAAGEGEGCEPAHPPPECSTYCTNNACGCEVHCVDPRTGDPR